MAKRTTRKTTYRRRQPQKQTTMPFKWLIVGIAIGVIIPGYFLLKSPRNKSSDLVLNQTSEVVSEQTAILKQHAQKKTPKKTAHVKQEADYEFYNLLSEDGSDSKNKSVQSAIEKSYSLKLPAVNSYAEADQLKAQLALIGIDHVIVAKSATNTTYNVTLGPYSTKSQALDVKKQLKENDIVAELIKASFD